jgi:hypothetical protein
MCWSLSDLHVLSVHGDMSKISTTNGELPCLQARVISAENNNVLIQVRCPSGLSMLTGDDALELADNIKHQLTQVGFESASVRAFKEEFERILASKTDKELQAEFDRISESLTDQEW